jgi:opacity protein-like surface antigen
LDERILGRKEKVSMRSFFVWGSIVAVCLVLVAADDVFAQQPVSFGIKAGVPFKGLLQTSGQASWQGFTFGSKTQTQHYAIGPVVDIRLPGQFVLETGGMYKAIEQQGPDVTYTSTTCISPEPDCEFSRSTFDTKVVSKVARSFEFPVAIQYHFLSRPLQPYVEGGFSYNHISGVFGTPSAGYNPSLPLPQRVMWPNTFTINRSGFLLGGGVEIKLSDIRLSPGVRYARYDNVEHYGPSQYGPFVSHSPVETPNALDFVLGIKLNSKFSGHP